MDSSALVELLALEDPSEGTMGDLAERYRLVQEAQERLREIAGALEDDLAARMEKDVMWTGAGWLSRSREKRSQWRDEDSAKRFRDDLAQTVVQAVAVDIETGEMDPGKRNIARATVELLYAIIPAFSDVKARGRQMGIDPGDYRSTQWVDKVKFTEDAAWSG